MVADGLILVVFMVIAASVFSQFENVPDYARIIAFVLIFFMYDPFMTSVFGGTLGHMLLGIRVRKEIDETQNVFFPFAVFRYILKVLLGWISLLTLSGNPKRKAIHDYLLGSVVVYSAKEDKNNP